MRKFLLSHRYIWKRSKVRIPYGDRRVFEYFKTCNISNVSAKFRDSKNLWYHPSMFIGMNCILLQFVFYFDDNSIDCDIKSQHWNVKWCIDSSLDSVKSSIDRDKWTPRHASQMLVDTSDTRRASWPCFRRSSVILVVTDTCNFVPISSTWFFCDNIISYRQMITIELTAILSRYQVLAFSSIVSIEHR